jgi:hypothetical protein
MNVHKTINPSAAVLRAITEGVELNNEGLRLQRAGRFAESEMAFVESLRIKRDAYAEESIHICIGLSGLADTYLEWGKMQEARTHATKMKEIATNIQSLEQLRIADEILVSS